MLKAAERYIVKSGLFGYDQSNSLSGGLANNNMDHSFGGQKSSKQQHENLSNHQLLPNGNGNGTANYIHNHNYSDGLQVNQYDSETSNSYGIVDSLRIEAMEKNITMLNREVKKIKGLEDSERQLQVDLGKGILINGV